MKVLLLIAIFVAVASAADEVESFISLTTPFIYFPLSQKFDANIRFKCFGLTETQKISFAFLCCRETLVVDRLLKRKMQTSDSRFGQVFASFHFYTKTSNLF